MTIKKKKKIAVKSTPKSKAAKVMMMLRRPNGATGQKLMKATGWQSHTVRGFINRLGTKMKVTASYRAQGHRNYAIAS